MFIGSVYNFYRFIVHSLKRPGSMHNPAQVTSQIFIHKIWNKSSVIDLQIRSDRVESKNLNVWGAGLPNTLNTCIPFNPVGISGVT